MIEEEARDTRVDRVPKYVMVRQWLAERILRGEFGNGARLPSESDLMGRFAASRVTVRAALSDLRKSGLIESHQGKGYFVRKARVSAVADKRPGFGELLAPTVSGLGAKVVGISEIPASESIAAALRLQPGAPVVRIERLRLGNGGAIGLDLSHFPQAIGRQLAEQDLDRHDHLLLLETALGIEPAFADIVLGFEAADTHVAEALGVVAGTMILRVERITYDAGGRPIDIEYLYGRGEAHQYHVRVARC